VGAGRAARLVHHGKAPDRRMGAGLDPAQIAIMKPEPYARALRGVLADLARTQDGATYLAASIGGLRQRYDVGGEDPRVGRSAPEIVLADGSRLADHLHGGAGVLIGAGPSPG
jgi:hypothetical protein